MDSISRKIQQAPVNLLVLLLRGYRYFISPYFGNRCRFHPSCSEYAQTALQHCGVVRGFWLTLRRLLRCHPWHPGGYDPVPNKKQENNDYGH